MSHWKPLVLAIAVLALAVGRPAVKASDDDAKVKAPEDAVMNFGSPVVPAGTGNHVVLAADPTNLTDVNKPNEVTIRKRGTVTFVVNGGGHGIAVHPVSKNTETADIAEDLCTGTPDSCAAALAQNNAYTIIDAKNNIVINVPENPQPANAFNRVDDPHNRLLGTSGAVPGAPDTVTRNGAFLATGNRIQLRFLKNGRYLVICMNRVHSLNDHMFGFVNVVGEGDDDD